MAPSDYPEELRKRLDRLTAVEHRCESNRDAIGRTDKRLDELAERVHDLEHEQAATKPIQALITKWVFAVVGVIALAVFTALLATIIVPKLIHIAPPAATQE